MAVYKRCFFVFLFCAAAIAVKQANSAEEMRLGIKGKAVYSVRLAVERDELQKGLMFVHDLPKNEGMLFDVRHYVGISMWMKNTYIPLDILFIGCDFKVVDIYKNAKPLSLKKIGSSEKFCYVLEINGGETEKKGIAVGDEVLPENMK